MNKIAKSFMTVGASTLTGAGLGLFGSAVVLYQYEEPPSADYDFRGLAVMMAAITGAGVGLTAGLMLVACDLYKDYYNKPSIQDQQHIATPKI